MKTSGAWLLPAIAVLAFGCAKQQYAECPPPDEDLKVLFKPKNEANPFSHSFCIVCNPSLEPEEYAAWVESMGAAATDVPPETPCLYAYSDREANPEGHQTLAQCQAAICDGGASYSDVVSRRNGNIDLDPVIGPADE